MLSTKRHHLDGDFEHRRLSRQVQELEMDSLFIGLGKDVRVGKLINEVTKNPKLVKSFFFR